MRLGRLHTQAGAHDIALAEFDLALTLNPNFAMAHYGRGLAQTFSGHSKEGLAELEAAIRLSPHDPQMWLFEMLAAIAAMGMRDFDSQHGLGAKEHSPSGRWILRLHDARGGGRAAWT